MTLTQIAIWGVLIFTVMGLLFGMALAATARKFHVPNNPVVDEVRGSLPSANCGACGYAGCGAYADAVVEQEKVSPGLCTPGGKDVANRVAQLTGKAASEVAERIAVLRCEGREGTAALQAQYLGIDRCAAANLAFAGPKACKSGCLGFGDCVSACPFDAIKIGSSGIAEVRDERCTGCGRCVNMCPKHVLELVPRDCRVFIGCKIPNQKATEVRSACAVGCVACRRCVKACPAAAIEWTGNTLLVNHQKCIAYGQGCNEVCLAVCTVHILHRKKVEAARHFTTHEGEPEALASAL